MSAPLYAFTRSLDPAKGQPVVLAGAWQPGFPMVEIVVRILRTPRGTYKPDPTFGIPYDQIDKGLPSAPRTLQLAIEAQLAKYVTANRMTKLKVEVERDGGRINYAVSFDDPKLNPGAGRSITPIRGAL